MPTGNPDNIDFDRLLNRLDLAGKAQADQVQAGMKDVAQFSHTMYTELVLAGFTDQQAMFLVQNTVNALFVAALQMQQP